MPLLVDTKPENNYDYLLKENPLSGGITGPSLKLHAQQNQQQQQPNLMQQHLLQQQQHSSQVTQQQGKSTSLLNRLPQSVKQQLALNLNDNEQLQKNLKLNQNQQSPDRIWTDRDVNPRLAANPQKERPHQQNTVVIGKGEVKHLKGGKVLNRPLSNNNELIGSLSDRIFLNKIEEEGRNHYNQYDHNKLISEQHKDLSQKIIQNALNNQINKINSHSNIQDIYRKYQQAKEENNQYHNLYNNANSHDQQSLKGSGEHLSFIRSMQQKHDDNVNEIISKVVALQNSDHKEDYSNPNNNPNLTNHIKQQLNKQKQQQISDDMISKIHKSKINQLIQKAVPNSSSQSSSRKGVTANSSNVHANNANMAKQSINNSSSQNSNYATNQYQSNQPNSTQQQQQQQQQQRSQNKKSPPHSSNYNNLINFQSQSSNNNIHQQTSSGSSNTNQTHFHNSQLHQQLYQHNIDLYNNSISTISNTVMSKLQNEIKPSTSSSSKRTQNKDHNHHALNKQARTSSLIKNLSGGDEIFNESNYKISKQQKPNQVSTAIIVPSPQHLLQQYQSEQLSHNYMGGGGSTQNNYQSKSPISSTVSTSKAINQKQQSYSSMHNHLQQQSTGTNKAHAGKNTPNSTASNANQNGKVFFKSINASGNTSGQALKHGSMPNNNNNNININTILINNYVSPTNHMQQNTTPLNVINNFKSTNNTSVKSYQESHQNSMDKNGSSSRQLQQQQQQQLQNHKNNSTNQSTSNNLNSNHIHNFNANNSTFNQNNNILNFDLNSQLSRTMMSTNNRGGGFIEVNSFNNNETTLNQKSLIQPGSSHSTTGITNNNNAILQPNTPILSSHTGGNLPSSQKISSPNHKKKQKSESLSKSSQKINNNQNILNNQQSQMNSQFNASQNMHFLSNELSGGMGISSQSPSASGANIIAGGGDLSQQNLQHQVKQGLPSPSSQSQNQNQFVPLKKQEFKLNISKIINQQHEFNQNSKNLHSSSTTNMNSHNINNLMNLNHNEENQENSYGFWTSRSNKQTYQHSSQLQQHGSQHGSASNSKYSSINSKQTNLTDRKMLKTSNVSKQRKEAPAANLTDRNQYHRSQQYNSIQQKSENQKPSPSMRKSNTQKVQNLGQNSLNSNANSKSIENHLINYNSFNMKEKATGGLSGSGSITGFAQQKK